MSKDALLEIGCEALPANFLFNLEQELERITKEAFLEKKLKFKNIKIFISHRRLTIFIENLEEETEKEIIEILGPPVSIGKNEKGNFTLPAYRFAETYKVNVRELQVKSTPKGEYLCILKTLPPTPTILLLPEIFKKIVSSIVFPKTMVWNETKFRFARPIRSILALYGDKVVKFELAGVKSSFYTSSFFAKKKIKIRNPEKYFETLKNTFVIIDQNERKRKIEKAVISLSKKLKGEAYLTEQLLNENVFTTEFPTPVVCSFNKDFLNLPQELLINCLKKNKFFLVSGTNHFIAIRDGISEYQEIVKKGYERVIDARLQDAKFRFESDLQTTLEEKVKKLKNIVLHEKLSNLYERTNRIIAISEYLSKLLNIEEEHLKRAVYLSKADLSTLVVSEYPELQGIIGGIYATRDKEEKIVCDAIKEQYLDSPKTTIGKMIALSDTIEMIVSNFAVGYRPTGSGDPYGIKGMAFRFLKIILENSYSFSLNNLVKFILGILNIPADITSITNFLKQRLQTIFLENGYKEDEINAVFVNFDDVIDLKKRLEAIHTLNSEGKFNEIIIPFKRAANILKQAKNLGYLPQNKEVRPDKFVQEEEKQLFYHFQKLKISIETFIKNKDYITALEKIKNIKSYIDNFFDKVLVLTEDKELRENRLSILKNIVNEFFKIADFSLLKT